MLAYIRHICVHHAYTTHICILFACHLYTVYTVYIYAIYMPCIFNIYTTCYRMLPHATVCYHMLYTRHIYTPHIRHIYDSCTMITIYIHAKYALNLSYMYAICIHMFLMASTKGQHRLSNLCRGLVGLGEPCRVCRLVPNVRLITQSKTWERTCVSIDIHSISFSY